MADGRHDFFCHRIALPQVGIYVPIRGAELPSWLRISHLLPNLDNPPGNGVLPHADQASNLDEAGALPRPETSLKEVICYGNSH
jgi:hypothetical protein